MLLWNLNGKTSLSQTISSSGYIILQGSVWLWSGAGGKDKMTANTWTHFYFSIGLTFLGFGDFELKGDLLMLDTKRSLRGLLASYLNNIGNVQPSSDEKL